MSFIKIAAIVLILGGIFSLANNGFTYTKDTESAKIGPLQISVEEKKTVNVPMWAGIGMIALGSGILFLETRKQ
ncbi:MAG: hypothetical protein PHG52_02815 [Synergistaceae bacterium]|nr:hypothetical protein [Synergistaceae bacterium]MDD4704704.1 hypothetical protein [Synergistaceae bacterium]